MKKSETYSPEEVETLKRLYPDHFTYEIAEIMGKKIKSIEWKILKLGLTGRPAPSTLRKFKKWRECEKEYGVPIKDLLEELHWKLNLPILNGMDKALKTNTRSVTSWMEELGVHRRSTSEDNIRRYSTMDEEQIKAQTHAANVAVRKNGHPWQIGRIPWSAGLTKETHSGLKSSSDKHIGKNNPMWNVRNENHHMWKGGKRYWRLTDWIEISRLMKERDNHTCQDCGITQDDLFKSTGLYLHVHHIVPYRICKEHDPNNLITLCPSCHSKADGNLTGDLKRVTRKSPKLEDVPRNQSTIFQF